MTFQLKFYIQYSKDKKKQKKYSFCFDCQENLYIFFQFTCFKKNIDVLYSTKIYILHSNQD